MGSRQPYDPREESSEILTGVAGCILTVALAGWMIWECAGAIMGIWSK